MLVCIVASIGFWVLFKGRNSYPDFQGLFPVILWLMLMLLHLVLGSIAISRVWKSDQHARYSFVFVYFIGSFFIHLTLLFDYNGWNEKLYVSVQDVLHPEDSLLHRALEQKTINLSEVRKLLDGGGNADSWRGTWAIWKANGTENKALMKLLLDSGAQPDRNSRSGTSHKNFKYRIDGPLERILVRRDKRSTILCVELQSNSKVDSDFHSPSLINNLLIAGANAKQLCKGQFPGSVIYQTALRGDAANLKLLLKHGGTTDDQTELTKITERFRWAASSDASELLQALIALLPRNDYQATYDTALREAIAAGKPDAAILLLGLGAQPQQSDMISLAINKSAAHPGLVVKLIAAGANPNIEDSGGKSPIALALSKKNLPLLKTLIKLGADVKQSGIRYGTLHAAFKIKQPDRLAFVKVLVAAGANLEKRNQNDNSFLMRAARADDVQSVQFAIQSGADLNATNIQGNSAGILAQKAHASSEIFTLLNFDNVPPLPTLDQLIYAVRFGSLTQVIQLLKDGASVNGLNKVGVTPLEAAMRKSRPEIYVQLLQSGADPESLVRNGSPLKSGIQRYTVQRLREARGLKKRDNASIPILLAAAMSGSVVLVDTLLQAGAKPNAIAFTGESALHMMAFQRKDYTAVVTSLVQAGINTSSYNQDGYTAMTLAAKNQCIELIDALIRAGADINLKDAKDRTVIGEAIRNGGILEIIFHLLKMNAQPNKADLEYVKANFSPNGLAEIRAAIEENKK
ncbi:MAG: ankyrin repeat domain-containing protein [Pseudomonadales bacterium]|nr:ankyrin repeat domain-containing protein [Pseudomonadales bacterium]